MLAEENASTVAATNPTTIYIDGKEKVKFMKHGRLWQFKIKVIQASSFFLRPYKRNLWIHLCFLSSNKFLSFLNFKKQNCF